jgi:hypothetical protein
LADGDAEEVGSPQAASGPIKPTAPAVMAASFRNSRREMPESWSEGAIAMPPDRVSGGMAVA